MAWIEITENDLLTRLADKEFAAVQDAARKEGQGNPIPEVIAQVTRRVRGFVAACERNRLGNGMTIPDECLQDALAILVVEVCLRLPLKSLITEARAKAAEKANAFFRDAVSTCRFAIEQPADVSPEVIAGGASPLVLKPRRKFRGEGEL